MPQQKTATITERRASYPLQQRLKIYSPDTMARRLNQEKTQGKLVVNGVNILNKSCLDKDIILDRMKQRRETHNRVERRRRDMLNGLINQLAQAMPQTVFSEPEKCHRAEILRQAISYIESIKRENEAMRIQLGHNPATVTMETMPSSASSSLSPSPSSPSSSSSSCSSSPSSSPTSSFLPQQQTEQQQQSLHHIYQLPQLHEFSHTFSTTSSTSSSNSNNNNSNHIEGSSSFML